MPVTLIAAVASNGVIGRDGRLPWHLPADLKRFQRRTSGHHLIVGRATWESIGRPLPDRTFVVVTRRPGASEPGLAFARTVEEGIALARAAGDAEPFVAGGTGIFREALERGLVDRLELTRIDRAYEGDARFPDLDPDAPGSGWRRVEREPHAAEPERDRPAFEFVVYERERR
jgi:dihydrofolate reductase